MSYEGAADLPTGRQGKCSTAPARAANANDASYVEPYETESKVVADLLPPLVTLSHPHRGHKLIRVLDWLT